MMSHHFKTMSSIYTFKVVIKCCPVDVNYFLSHTSHPDWVAAFPENVVWVNVMGKATLQATMKQRDKDRMQTQCKAIHNKIVTWDPLQLFPFNPCSHPLNKTLFYIYCKHAGKHYQYFPNTTVKRVVQYQEAAVVGRVQTQSKRLDKYPPDNYSKQ